ncbi:MAG TPA: nicotinate-nucleotide adenylyltransferase [Peptococcaceae bacterium]|nr:nicotinate-nucleotide adenylyltransferase [Peptococcaceae bacterium]
MEAKVIEALKGGRRLGIMGGTFDPIHYGHLVAAETARDELGLDNVLFIPTGIPPHKLNRRVTDANLRYAMVEMSIRNNKYFKVSKLEIEREGPTYTIDTLRILHTFFPEQELYFITGTDALRELFTWREPEEIIRLAKIIGASRPGYDSYGLLASFARKYSFPKDQILLLEIPALAISSTDIRARVHKKKSIRYLLPDEVRLFIKENKLYQEL